MTTPTLAFAHKLPLPIEALTQTFGLIGKRGAGKTYAALRLAESMLEAHGQIVFIDPIGKAWSLRLAADGKGPGFEIPVFGGHHGDLPLEAGAGARLADLVVDKGLSCVLDVSLMRKGDRKAFVTAFAEQLWHRKKQERAPSPLHLFLEESQVFVPQRAAKGEERMLGAFEDLVRLGRNYGIGATLVSQRPQSVNKEVLNQTECLLTLQLVGPQERKAVREWIREQDPERLEAVDELPGLEVGQCFLWSPGWLRVFRKVRITRRTTFDASATPTAARARRKAAAPRKLGDDELEQLRASMAEVVERAEAEDPKALRKRIAELERALRAARAAAPSAEDLERARTEGAREASGAWADTLVVRQTTAANKLSDVQCALQELSEILHRPIEPDPRCTEIVDLFSTGRKERREALGAPPARAREPRAAPTSAVAKGEAPAEVLTGPEQRILDALAWLEAVGVTPAQETAAAFLAGYRPGGGAWCNPRGRLRQRALIDYVGTSSTLALTDEGRALAHWPDTPGTSADLQRMVLERLPGPERRLLEPLSDAYPSALSNEDLAASAGYAAGGGAYANPRGRLRSFGLVEYPETGMVRASGVLFVG